MSEVGRFHLFAFLALCFCFGISLELSVSLPARSDSLRTLFSQRKTNVDELDVSMEKGNFDVVDRSFNVTDSIVFAGSGRSVTNVRCISGALTGFGDADQTIRNLALTSVSSRNHEHVGGLIQIGSGHDLKVENVTIYFGHAVKAGGAIGSIGGNVMLNQVRFVGCRAAFGGAVYVYGSNQIVMDSVEFVGGSGHSGSAMYVARGNVVIRNSEIEESGNQFGSIVILNTSIQASNVSCGVGNGECVSQIQTTDIQECGSVNGTVSTLVYCTNDGVLDQFDVEAVCGNGKYQAKNGSCQECSVCGVGSFMKTECTSTTDTECVACVSPSTFHWRFVGEGCGWECDASEGFYKNSSSQTCQKCEDGKYLSGGMCRSCDVCGGGYEMTQACGGSQNTVCEACSEGLPARALWISAGKSCGFVCGDGRILKDGSCLHVRVNGSNIDGHVPGYLLSGSINGALIDGLSGNKITRGVIHGSLVRNVDASQITSGTFNSDRLPSGIHIGPLVPADIPNLPAAKITSGTLDVGRIPPLPTSKTASGVFDIGRIPDLSASKITSGTLDSNRMSLNAADIPHLPASKISSGSFGIDRIPTLSASKVTSGVFGLGRIPDLPAARITSGAIGVERLNFDWIVGLWQEWTKCSDVSCGFGNKTRYRSISCPITGRCLSGKPDNSGTGACFSGSLCGSLDSAWDSDGVLTDVPGRLHDIIVDSNNNVIAVGYRSISGRGDEAMIFKYASDGSELWNVTNGSSGSQDDRLWAVDVDSSDVVYGAGWTLHGDWGGSNVGSWDSIVWSVDKYGSHRWILHKGASGSDRGFGIRVTHAVFVAGIVDSAFPGVIGHGGSGDFYVMKLATSGSEEWIFQYGTSGYEETGWTANTIAISDSVLFVSGYTAGSWQGSNAGSVDIILLRVDMTGSQLSVSQTGSASYERGLGVSVEANFVYQTGRTSGSLPGNINVGYLDAFVIQYAAGGSRNWIRQFGSSSNDYGEDCVADRAGTVYVTGGTYGAIGASAAGSGDVFVVSYNSVGSSRFQFQFGSSANDIGFGITFHQDSVYVAGFYAGLIAVAKVS